MRARAATSGRLRWDGLSTFNLQWVVCTVLLINPLLDCSAGRVVHRVRRAAIAPGNEAYHRKEEQTPEGFHYRVGAIADLDKFSRVKISGSNQDEWISYLFTADLYIQYNPENLKEATINIDWKERKPETLRTGMAYYGRGQELSELIVYGDKLLTCDDRTGIVYQLIPNSKNESVKAGWRQVPWVILAGGDGTLTKGFKCEWATVKDGNLWVGSHGTLNELQYVKEITPKGQVTTHDWGEQYKKLASAVGIHPPGYVTHEAVGWSDYHQKWVFIPRKVNSKRFNPDEDDYAASNVIILADADFSNIQTHGMAGELMPSHGVSSFKWLPLAGTNHSYIVALKAEEIGQSQASFILAFDMDGKVLFPETKIEDVKYEGLEFI